MAYAIQLQIFTQHAYVIISNVQRRWIPHLLDEVSLLLDKLTLPKLRTYVYVTRPGLSACFVFRELLI